MFRANLDRFRATRARTLALVRDLTQAQADYTPAQGRWSVGEVLDHLLLSEKFFRGEITRLIKLRRAGLEPVLRRSLRDLNISVRFLPRPLVPLMEVPFTLFSLLTPRPVQEFLLRSRLVPARHPDVAAPRKGRPVPELRDDLASSLQETVALFEANADVDFRELIHQHPLLGNNNSLDLLRILTLHEERHQGQIADGLASLPQRQGISLSG
jgi:uncharacterized damage-inducible protein DinB